MSIAITSKELRRAIQPLVVLLLLVFYVAGTSHLELLHSSVHSHDAIVTHSDEQEGDPCHRFLHHNDVEKGCGHDAHLIVSEKCDMCDLGFYGDQNVLTTVVFSCAEFSVHFFGCYKSNVDSYWAVISSSRAPPVLA